MGVYVFIVYTYINGKYGVYYGLESEFRERFNLDEILDYEIIK